MWNGPELRYYTWLLSNPSQPRPPRIYYPWHLVLPDNILKIRLEHGPTVAEVVAQQQVLEQVIAQQYIEAKEQENYKAGLNTLALALDELDKIEAEQKRLEEQTLQIITKNN